MIRPSPTFLSAARSTFSAQASSAPRLARTYATSPPAPGGSQSNLPLFLALGGLGGLGAWYGMGGFGDGAKAEAKKAVAKVEGAASALSGALSKDEFRDFTLKEVKPYNHDSSTFVFELPDGAKPGMNVASAVVVKASGEEGLKDKNGKDVIRPYTPTSSPETAGHIDFLVKKYQGGLMTTHIHNLKPGDKLAIKGPIPKFPYKPNEFEEIALIGGGSGITPLWQIIQAIEADPSDKTRVTLIYSNKSDKDILLREEFDRLSKSDDRFRIVYGLDKKNKGIPADTFEGYITPEILTKYLPNPGHADKIKIFVCGPPPQVEALSGGKGPKGSQGELKGLIADLGYQPSQVYKF